MSAGTDTLVVSGQALAHFVRAAGLAVSPDGRIYVADRDLDRIQVFSSTGKPIHQLGGPGTDEGQFDEPMDVDPGIGLIFSVADSRNGRIQRFTRDFRFVESLPVFAATEDGSGNADPSFRAGVAGVEDTSPGSPVAVTTSFNDDLYVVESGAGVVVRWDRDRRNRWTIGNEGDADARLLDPIDLEVAGEHLFVADRSCACILQFDLFGTFIRTIARNRYPEMRALGRSDGGFVLVSVDRLTEFDSSGRLLRERVVEIEGDLVGAAVSNGRYLLLTVSGLYVATSLEAG